MVSQSPWGKTTAVLAGVALVVSGLALYVAACQTHGQARAFEQQGRLLGEQIQVTHSPEVATFGVRLDNRGERPVTGAVVVLKTSDPRIVIPGKDSVQVTPPSPCTIQISEHEAIVRFERALGTRDHVSVLLKTLTVPPDFAKPLARAYVYSDEGEGFVWFGKHLHVTLDEWRGWDTEIDDTPELQEPVIDD